MATLLQKICWFCAGVDRTTLDKCPIDHARYTSIGLTVLFTGLFAAISSGYALYTIFSGSHHAISSACTFGFLWGFMILNIDRFLVMSLKKTGKTWTTLGMALPRLTMAIMIGMVIARPLELKIFDKEIREKLRIFYHDRNTTAFLKRKADFDSTHIGLAKDLERSLKERDKAKSEWEYLKKLSIAERTGNAMDGLTLGKKGEGPNFRDDTAKANQYGNAYQDKLNKSNTLETQFQTERKLAGLDTTLQTASHLDDSVNYQTRTAGFYDRNKMLSKISAWTPFTLFSKRPPEKPANPDNIYDPENDATVFFISLLFMFVECLPVITKLMTAKTTYDIAFAEKEEQTRIRVRYETYEEKFRITTTYAAKKEVFNDATEKWKTAQKADPNLHNKYFSTQNIQSN